MRRSVLLLTPLLPLALWACAIGPLTRLRGINAVAAQTVAVLVPLVLALILVILQQEDAVTAIDLFVRQRHVRLGQRRDEVGVRAVRDARDPVAGGAAHGQDT